MVMREIWDKFPEFAFWNFKISKATTRTLCMVDSGLVWKRSIKE